MSRKQKVVNDEHYTIAYVYGDNHLKRDATHYHTARSAKLQAKRRFAFSKLNGRDRAARIIGIFIEHVDDVNHFAKFVSRFDVETETWESYL